MKMNHKSNHLSRIRITFIMVLFVMCFTMHALFCGNYNPYESLDQAAVIESLSLGSNPIAQNEIRKMLEAFSGTVQVQELEEEEKESEETKFPK